MKAIDILLEDPFGSDVQRDSGLIVPKSVQDQLDAEAAKVREQEAAIKAQEQAAAEKRARREAKAKEYFRQQADTDANRAREKAEAEKNARRAKREKKQFDLLRKQSRSSLRSQHTPVTILFGDTIESTMSKEDFKKWLKKNRQHYKQYVKPFEKVKRFTLVVRVLTLLGVSLIQLNEIWEDYNAVKTLYHMEPQQITQETHDFYMQYLDYQMIKVVIPYLAAACVRAILASGKGIISVLKKIRNATAVGTAATAATGVSQIGWIPVVIETAVIIGVEYFITNDTFENNLEEYFRAFLAHHLMGYSNEDIARLEKDINLQVEEEKRQALAAQVGEKSDKDKFLDLMRKADPTLQN